VLLLRINSDCQGGLETKVLRFFPQQSRLRDGCERMRICIPTIGNGGLEDKLSPHFGRAPTFTIVDTDSGEVTVINNRSDHMGGVGKPPEQIKDTGSSIVLCPGLGPNALTMLMAYGMQVFVGASGTARDAIYQFKNGRLRTATMESACREHKH
jgi:predicted Fe-Mo cluster-binding NifX family protein